jgi:hypothetical protein
VPNSAANSFALEWWEQPTCAKLARSYCSIWRLLAFIIQGLRIAACGLLHFFHPILVRETSMAQNSGRNAWPSTCTFSAASST